MKWNCRGRARQFAHRAVPQIPHERRRMVRVQADVLIQMKQRHLVPRQIEAHQVGKRGELACPRGEDANRFSVGFNCGLERGSSFESGGAAKFRGGRMNRDAHTPSVVASGRAARRSVPAGRVCVSQRD